MVFSKLCEADLVQDTALGSVFNWLNLSITKELQALSCQLWFMYSGFLELGYTEMPPIQTDTHTILEMLTIHFTVFGQENKHIFVFLELEKC